MGVLAGGITGGCALLLEHCLSAPYWCPSHALLPPDVRGGDFSSRWQLYPLTSPTESLYPSACDICSWVTVFVQLCGVQGSLRTPSSRKAGRDTRSVQCGAEHCVQCTICSLQHNEQLNTVPLLIKIHGHIVKIKY